MSSWSQIFILVLCSVLFAAAAEAAAAAALNLTRKLGDDVTLSLGQRQLRPGDTLVWSCGPETGKENVLFHNEIGTQDKPTIQDRLDLDLTTGALTIKHLSATDSAVYYGQIINGNGFNQFYNLMVEGPDPIQPIQPTVEPQQHANIGIIIGVVAVAVVVLICLLVTVIVKKKKICSSTDTIV